MYSVFDSPWPYHLGKKCYGSTEVSKSSGVGSTPSFPALNEPVTQLAECQFSKLDVAGSTPVWLTTYVDLHLTAKIPPCDGGYASSILVGQPLGFRAPNKRETVKRKGAIKGVNGQKATVDLGTVNSTAEYLFYIQNVGGSNPSPCILTH